jgi:hypothetical protein
MVDAWIGGKLPYGVEKGGRRASFSTVNLPSSHSLEDVVMKSILRMGFWMAIGAAALVSSAAPVCAQGGGRGGFGRGFGGYSRTQLVTLKEVQDELKLTEDQKKLATETLEKLNADRAEARQSAGDDRNALQEKNTKLAAEADAKIAAKLDDAQKKRLMEIFVQKNPVGNALADAEVQKSLGLSEEAIKKIDEARTANREAMMAAMQELGRDASPQDRAAKMETLNKTASEKLFSAISAEQKAAFEKLGGEKLEVDLSPLQPQRRPGGGGRQNN